MVEKIQPLLREIVQVDNDFGEMKSQTTFELDKWDTSKMDGYVTGMPVKTGFNLAIRTIKPDKKYPRQRVDIDIADPNIWSILDKVRDLINEKA